MNLQTHRAGFVHLIGKPNAGKSTLFNTLIKKSLSIVTHKPQTTRQDIIGIVNTPFSQTIYMDTPGYIQAKYALQKAMVKSIQRTLPGADILLWVVDAREEMLRTDMFENFIQTIPTFLLLNKIDLLTENDLKQKLEKCRQVAKLKQVIPLSARKGTNIDLLCRAIEKELPVHLPFYDKEDTTDKPIEFFVAEIIRKVLFLQYQQEVPYSTSVIVTNYQKEERMIRVEATIYTERLSQKKILIGKQGKALERLCISVRQELSIFLGKSVFFKPYVKILPDWRKKPKILQRWGYM